MTNIGYPEDWDDISKRVKEEANYLIKLKSYTS